MALVSGSQGSASTSGPRVLLGELLVQSKVLTQEQLAEVLSGPRPPGKKLGQILIERGWITEAQLTQTLSLQLSVPWVSLYHIDFSRQLLNRVSRDLAEQYCLIPIFVRHVKGQGETLYVALDDPTNEAALAEVSRVAALPTRPMIASASDIRSAIRVYYGEPAPSPVLDLPVPPRNPTDLNPNTIREGRGAVTPGSQPPPARQKDAPPPPPKVKAPFQPLGIDEPAPVTTRSSPPSAVPPEKPAPHAEESEPTRKRRNAMLNLTLLDGTTVKLPSRKKAETEGPTARDYIAALRARSHGADTTEILGENPNWEPVVAALLSILLRKGLIADWEFVEELKKI